MSQRSDRAAAETIELEHGLRVGRRSTNYPQDLGRRGFPLQGFLNLTEQPRVLDRDHRLIGERLDELDLSARKSPGFRARERKNALHPPLAQERNANYGAEVSEFRRPAQSELIRRFEHVGDFDDLAHQGSVANMRPLCSFGCWVDGMADLVGDEFQRAAGLRADPKKVAVSHVEGGVRRAAQQASRVGEPRQQSVEIDPGTADDVDDLRCRLLSPPRLGELAFALGERSNEHLARVFLALPQTDLRLFRHG